MTLVNDARVTADSHEVTKFCQDLEYHLRQYGVITTAHYEPPIREFIAAALRAYANAALEECEEFLLTHRVAWFSSAPHHRVILETEPDAAMKTMAEAIRALQGPDATRRNDG